MDAEELVLDAFAQLGIDARVEAGAADKRIDLLLDPDGVGAAVEVKRRSLVTDEVAARLLAEVDPAGGALLVVGDRVTDAARRLLTSRRSGYYDLRGRLALRTGLMVIDAEVEPITERATRTSALAGKAGLEVATAVLMEPKRRVTVRRLARELGRSASTVSEVLGALRRDGLLDSDNAVADTRLFWRVADRWKAPLRYLAQVPPNDDVAVTQALRLGFGDLNHDAGWALTDTVAAAAYGAPAAVRAGQVLHFYVPDPTLARRASTLLGGASAADARCSVRVAPVPAVCQHRFPAAGPLGEWPLVHPLFVALDLAQDEGRGREILEAWTPGERWTRVW
jgi:hypothetical protein